MMREKLFAFFLASVYLAIIASVFLHPGRGRKNSENEVVFWHAGAGQERIAAIKELIAKFEEENPSVKVKLKVIPWGQKPHEKVQIAIASRTEPDIASVGTPFDKIIAEFGALEPLDAHFDRDLLDDFFQKTVVNGRVVSLPWFMDVRALIYRKDYLKKKGIPEPEKSWTWDEFLKHAMALTEDRDGDGITDVYGYATTARYAYQFLVFIWQNGGRLYSPDGKRAAVASREAVEAVQFFVDLMKKYKVSPKFTTESMFIIRKMFAEGKVAMFMDCSDAALALLSEPALQGKVGVGQIPHRKQKAAFAGADVLVVFRRARNKEEALKFLRFLVRKDNLLFYCEKTGFSPPRRSVAAYEFFKKDPVRRAFAAQAEVGRFWRLPPFTPTPRRILTRYVQMAVEGKLSVEEALRKAEEEMNREIGSLF